MLTQAEKGVEILQRSNAARDGRNGFAIVFEPINIGLNGFLISLHDRVVGMKIKILAKLANITEIGAESICRSLFFVFQIVFKNLKNILILQILSLLSDEIR